MAIPSSLLRNLNIEAQMGRGAGDSLRSKKMSEIMRSMPRQAARIGTMAPIQERPDTSLQQGLGDLAKSIKAASDMKKERAATAAFEQLYNQPMVVDPAMQNMSGPDMMEMPMVRPQPTGMDVMSLAMQFPGTKASANAMKMGQIMNAQEQNQAMNDYRDRQLAQQERMKRMDVERLQAQNFTMMPLEQQKEQYPNVDHRTTRLMVNGYNQVKPTPVQDLETKQALRKSSAPVVNVDTKGRTAEAEAEGTSLVKFNNEIDTAAMASEKNMTENLMLAKSMNDQTGENDQLPSALKTKMGSWLIWAGMSPRLVDQRLGNVQNGQQFQSLIFDQLLKKMMMQKGPQTKEDQAIMLKTLPGLGVGRRARDFLLRAAIAVAQRDIDKANFWASHKEQNGTRKGAVKAYFAHEKGMPLFGRNPTSNRFVFFNEYREKMSRLGMDASEIRSTWKSKYGKSI